jgi:hypothetical protein
LPPHGKVKNVAMRRHILVYVPAVVPQPVAINYPTSHIDIAPTLLDLLGIATGADLQQGSSIFSPGIENRCLFLEMNFFGAFRLRSRKLLFLRPLRGRCTRVERLTLLTKALCDSTTKRHKMPAKCLPNNTQANESS